MIKCLIAILLLMNCNTFAGIAFAQSKSFVPLEFEYPDAILATPKTFTYKNMLTGAIRFRDLTLERKDTNVIIRWKEYDASPIIDSCTEINDKIADHYLIINGRASKAVITQDSVYRDGSRLGEKVQTFYFSLDTEISLLMSIRSSFLKDTSINWLNKSVPCIVIQSFYLQKLTNSLFPDKPKETNGVNYFYFGKDVGLLMYRSDAATEKSAWQLVEIKDGKN